ncbi:MAG: PAS domain-containing sensor histidine kinase [Bacteroides sp.]|jgi:protein-histidine pros-kinase|nr:PAS domain-containing sensor histidine kinase [Bacteroides sp.]
MESNSQCDYGVIIERAPDSILLVDKTGVIQFVNCKAEVDFGYKKEELINQKIEVLIPSRFWSKHVSYRTTYAEKPKMRRMGMLNDLYGLRKNGDEFPVDVSISPMYLQNGDVLIVTLVRDITDKRMLFDELVEAKEKAEEANRMKSAFLATVSHELRTPLNHIFGFSSLISEMSKENDIKEFSDLIHESCANLVNLIDDIFQLALVEESTIVIRENEISIIDLFLEQENELKETLLSSGKGADIELKLQIDKGLFTKKIITDKSKVRQAMSYLIKNAVKFTARGYILLQVDLLDGDVLSISLKDTGRGIPEEKLQMIFELFTQSEDGYTRDYDGLGIGLAICRRIVRAMGGEIAVESEEGKGSIFTINLPVKIAKSKPDIY